MLCLKKFPSYGTTIVWQKYPGNSLQNKIKLVKTFVEIISCTMFFQTLLFLVFVAEDAIEVKQKGPFNIHLQ